MKTFNQIYVNLSGKRITDKVRNDLMATNGQREKHGAIVNTRMIWRISAYQPS